MNCRTVQDLTSAYLEGEATVEERRVIDAHLPLCRRCAADMHDTRRMLSLVHGLPRDEASADFTDTVMQRVRDAAAVELAAVRGWRDFLPDLSWARIEWPRLVWAPAAVAAGVLMTLGGIRVGLVPVAGLTPKPASVAAVEPAPVRLIQPAPRATIPASPPREVASVASLGPVVHRALKPAAAVALAPAADGNPLRDSQVSGGDAFELRGHDLLDPSYGAQLDLVLDRVSLAGRPLVPASTIEPVQEQRWPGRRLRTF